MLLSLLHQLEAEHKQHHSTDSSGGGLALPPQAWVLDSQPGLVPKDLDDKTGVARVLNTVHVSAWVCGGG